MSADHTATGSLPLAFVAVHPVAALAAIQRCLSALLRNTVFMAAAIAFASACNMAHAAELPKTYSDPSTATDNPSRQSAVLQTNSQVLPVDSAFALASFIEAGNSIILKWDIASGYYLYQKSLVVENEGAPISLELPAAEKFTDEFFGDVAIYRDTLLLRLPFTALKAGPGSTVKLVLTYQGCAKELYCYPPEQKALTLTLPE